VTDSINIYVFSLKFYIAMDVLNAAVREDLRKLHLGSMVILCIEAML
jgi:uncharacterized membrane protein